MRALDVVLAIGLALLAFLGQHAEGFVYPQILWLLLCFLLSSLALRRRITAGGGPAWANSGSVALNAVIVTGTVMYSGSADSELWVLYLIPIFASCLLLESAQAWTSVALISLFPLGFVLHDRIPLELGVVVKVGVLVGAGLTTLAVADREKLALAGAEASRRSLDQKAAEIQSTLSAQTVQLGKMASIGQMAGGIIHDLNAPLGVILGSSQLVLGNLPDDSPIRTDIERIERAARHCSNLTLNLLRWMRKEDHKVEAVSVASIVRASVQLSEAQMKRSGVTLASELDPSLPNVLISATEVQQVLLNLILNAVYQMPKGGTITVRSRPLDGFAEVAVLDQGPGLPPEALAKLFQPFFTTKPAGQGTGLGLSVSKAIVEKHGGRMWAENRPEGGAAFLLTLPLVDRGRSTS